jgi:hypothetical protein
MLSLSRQDKDLLLGIVREALAGEPAELAVFAATGEEVLREAAAQRGVREADSDTFFGGLDQSLGELMMHLVVLAAAEAIKYGWELSRERIGKILAEHRQLRAAEESPELAEAAELLIVCLVRPAAEPTPLGSEAAADTD